ncbi:MAG: PKD domain-containing protein, partial [Bacteroidetes bacterium]|nr:PKD domain-containing protein [Bacteroidota bacterium]
NTASNTWSSATLNNNDVVTVTAVDNICTSQPVSVSMEVNTIPTVTLSSDDADNNVCQGDLVTFTATPAGYTSYQFFDGSNSVQNTASNTYAVNTLAPGNSITVVADNNGCLSAPSNAIATTVTLAPVVNAGADQGVCDGTTAIQTLSGYSPAGGTWSGPGIVAGTDQFDPAVAGVGAHSLVYAYADPLVGCPGRDSIVFSVYALPTSNTPANVDMCEGASAQLSASGGVAYVWTPASNISNANIANPTATPASTTAYSVDVTDANGCVNTFTETVTVNPNPVAAFSIQSGCEGIATVFTNTTTPNGATYLWNFGDGNTSTSANPTHLYAGNGTYNVSLTTTLGTCVDTQTDAAVIQAAAEAQFTASPTEGYNDPTSPITFNNSTQNATTYFWDFGDSTSSSLESPQHVYQQPGVYTVTLVAGNAFGCGDTLTRTDYVRIYYIPKVFVPNAFSPGDGNGNNDILYIYANGTRLIDWKIFNRIGEKVFESNNYLEGWDGRYKGTIVPGVYVYTLKVVFDDGTTRDLKGTITLIK